jgi:hypothetical protein
MCRPAGNASSDSASETQSKNLRGTSVSKRPVLMAVFPNASMAASLPYQRGRKPQRILDQAPG